ncbi:MAG: class I SAM-dependent methyltransferase [Bryobacteraceae bacterium]|nr:class I SAM-dependent methyltransferase [Bryobacteraceae bacterium]
MIYRRLPRMLQFAPDFLQRHVLHFESEIELAAKEFARVMPIDARVLDAGAGEAQYKELFATARYTAVDLGIGDSGWSYAQLDAIAALETLPFRTGSFAGCLNIVTLEHVREPRVVIAEIARVLQPGGKLLLITPLEWEEHQQPHDYFRYTRHGLEYLLQSAGLRIESLRPAGGFFRLLSRRLFNAPQFFPLPIGLLILILVTIPALLIPLLDGLDQKRHFTLGHICIAIKPL